MDPNETSLFSNGTTPSYKPILLSMSLSVFKVLYYYLAQICVSIIGLGLIGTVIHSVVVRFGHLSQYRGPAWAPYTRLWLCKAIASGDSADIFVDINKRYGPIARIGPNNLLTDDPELTKRILSARSRYTRGPWFDFFNIDPHTPNLLSERHPGKHNRLRYRMAPGYAGKDIEGLEDSISERVSDFIDRIDKHWISEPGSTKVFEIGRRIQYLTLDMITHLCFGEPLGFVGADRDVNNFLVTTESQFHIALRSSIILELNTILFHITRFRWIKKAIIPSARGNTGIGMIMRVSKEHIDKRLQSKGEMKKDMLGSFLKHGLTPSEAETEISLSLLAGSDTTATAIRATLLYIISNSRVHARLVNEIDEAVKLGRISSPILDEEARELPYLQACIKEGLRRFPPVNLLREHTVPPEGDNYKGQHIPGGTFIGLNTWGVQLNPVFGDDPEVFRPERWLVDDENRIKEMNAVHELVFGYGTTKCLGSPIAMINLNKIFVELLKRFDIAVVNPIKPWTSICYGIFFQEDFHVTVTRRGHGQRRLAE